LNTRSRRPTIPKAPRPAPDTNHPRSLTMVWEKPQAIDWRFGMEITMYIANR
jgi:coenzyme PQQ precursor peptide PqqA